MKIGCSTLLYGGTDLDTALTHISAAGYEAVELCAIQGMAPHLDVGADAGTYREVAAKVADRGLAVESVGASGSFGDPERFRQVLDAAAGVGAPLVTTGAGGKKEDEASFREVVKAIQDITPECASRKVKLSVKPHVSQAVYDTASAARLMKEVDTDWVGINYDPTHIWRSGEMEVPEDTIGTILDHIISLRIRDVKGRQTAIGPVEGQVAPNGDLNLPALAEQFKRIPGLEYAVLEIVGARDFSLEQVDDVVRRSIAYFKPLLK